MVANTAPIFPDTPYLSPTPKVFTTASTTKDGTALTVAANLIAVAGADGMFLQRIRCKALGTNIASLLRVFYTSDTTGDPATAANNGMLEEWNLPATTLSETAVTQTVDVPINIGIPAGYRVFACVATTVAAGWEVYAIAGDF